MFYVSETMDMDRLQAVMGCDASAQQAETMRNLLLARHKGKAVEDLATDDWYCLLAEAVGYEDIEVIELEALPAEPQNDIGIDLAIRAFELIGSSRFEVSATLDLNRPESLAAFDTFKRVLCMAYEAGRKDCLANVS